MTKPLTAFMPLSGKTTTIGETELSTVSGHAIFSLSIPLGGETAFDGSVSEALKLDLPAPGSFFEKGSLRLIGLARDQFFLLNFDEAEPDEKALKQRLGEAAYVTDQSDSWISLRMKGPLMQATIERLSPIDLSAEVFPAGSIARTSMEHLSVIVMAEADGGFLLLSPQSSAPSFWHALEVSLQNVSH